MPGAARPMGDIGGAVGSGERAGGDTGPCGRVVGGACGESLHRFGAVGFETRLRAHNTRKGHAASVSGRAANSCAVCAPTCGIPKYSD